MFCKKNYRSSVQKKAFKVILVCMCMLMCMCMCMISTVPAWVELWLLSLPQARLTPSNYHLPPLPAWHHVESSSSVCQPQPVFSAASTSCLQEGPTPNPFFHFLCCSWCFKVADYSRPVAMTDCCCCPSPYWPHKIVQQSTGLLKPLIECMVSKKSFCIRFFLLKTWIFHSQVKI